jgi:hypothetical protein
VTARASRRHALRTLHRLTTMGSHICSPVLAALVLSSLFAASLAWSGATEPVTSGGAAGEMLEQLVNASKSRRLTTDDTIGELLNHPAFADFGRLLLPWDDRRYDNGMRLRNVGSLVPYHSYVDPGTVVNASRRNHCCARS